ncbi:HEAT repeat domain-containing protein [Nannocystis radixulma]|uniref:HEAT repeat domain-containing protein n=1 Tax=Nannocystis radixulma TaxID=2995305 RepID=A0ABT5BHG8_9BACT|nr:HEAT repeat domain-containing protein [Nannocystis radixulma]MDC0673558.1 HEAT repeat domain-containing protein [Nannocystis radixulma]
MDLRALVETRLAAHQGEFLWFSQYFQLARSNMSFETYRAGVAAEYARKLAKSWPDLPAPDRATIESWQRPHVGDERVLRGFAGQVYLALQGHGGEPPAALSSARWREYLAALESPERWLAAGRARETEGWTIEANACFAAARWLEPACAAEIAEVVAARPAGLPNEMNDLPMRDFPQLEFRRRHWHAWGMKNCGRLYIPSLLRWECDPNFSVRARIYRSLGQRPHPAAIAALHEGTDDPHPFARAQAVRSLGWCADPTFVARLRELASDDPDANVRRTAAKAVQRIVGWWTYFGEWPAIVTNKARTTEVVHALAAAALPAFAREVAIKFGWADDGSPLAAFVEALEPEALLHDPSDRTHNYGHWFRDAEALAANPAPELTDAAALAACHEPGAEGFEARRVLRFRELGTGAQRRRHLS